MKKLAIITTHPIQYNAPLFKLLTERKKIQVKVFYTWGEQSLVNKFDPGFGKVIEWDIPLLEGYEYEFVKNTAAKPGSGHFSGIKNPSVIADLNRWEPDAILVYGWSFVSHLKILRYFKGRVPVFFRGDSTLRAGGQGIKRLLRTFFLKWVYKYVDVAFYVGTNNKKYYEALGLKETQLVFAPHAIDNDRFEKDHTERMQQAMDKRRELGIPDDKLVLLYAGKLENVKDPAMIISAAKQLQDKAVHFIIAGNGALEHALKNLAGDNVAFMDFQNQQMMPVLYRMCDVFTLTSRSETWGLSINEAMACGRIILASDACGAAVDLVEDGINGFTFESGNSTDYIERIKALLESGHLRLENMKAASLKKISRWSYRQTAEALEDALLSVEN